MAPGTPLSISNCSLPSSPWKSWPTSVGRRPLAIENFMWPLERAIWRAPVLCVSAKNQFWWGRLVNFMSAIAMPDLVWLLQSHWGFCSTFPTFGRSDSLKQDCGLASTAPQLTSSTAPECPLGSVVALLLPKWAQQILCERLIPWELAWLDISVKPLGLSPCWITLPQPT